MLSPGLTVDTLPSQADKSAFLDALRHPKMALPLRPGIGVGPWRIGSQLGAGGMGLIAKGNHHEGDQAAAIKIASLDNAFARAAIRREASLLRTLKAPGIVEFLGAGAHEGRPWYAMALVPGRTLRWHLVHRGQASTPGAWALPDFASADGERVVLDLLLGLTYAVAHLHSRGICHRDLKPENIMMRPDGQPVLIDFGLATRFGGVGGPLGLWARDRLEVETGRAGTPLYMAPEQRRGDVVDGRADLYALGKILEELLGGVDSPHLNNSPLWKWVDRLVVEAPQQRLGHAHLLAAGLELLGAKARGGKLPRAFPLYRAPFVGREAVIESWQHHLMRAKAGQGVSLAIRGPAGVGKTRLASHLGQLAARAGILCLEGTCPPGQSHALGALMDPFQTLRDHRLQQGPQRSPAANLLFQYLEEVKGGPLGGLNARAEGRKRLRHAVVETFTTCLQDGPIALFIDEIQEADALTLDMLRALIPLCTQGLILITLEGVERPAHRGETEPLPVDARFWLAPLQAAAIERILYDMLALKDGAEPLVSAIVRAAGGNPLFAGEFLRAALEGDLLYADAQGRWGVDDGKLGALLDLRPEGRDLEQAVGRASSNIPVTEALAALIARRLSLLSPEALDLLHCLVVAGQGASLDFILGLMPRQDDALAGEMALGELEYGGFTRRNDGGQIFIAHPTVQRVVYAGLEAGRRCLLHASIAQRLKALGPRPQDQAPLAFHLERAGQKVEAAKWYREAAWYADSRFAFALCDRLIHRATGLMDRRDLTYLHTLNERMQRVSWRGRMLELEKLAGEVHDLACHLEDWRMACLADIRSAFVRLYQCRFPEAKDALERALGHRAHFEDLQIDCQLYGHLYSVHRYLGHKKQAATYLDQSSDAARRLAHPMGLMGMYADQAEWAELEGQGERALALRAAAIKEAGRAQLPWWIAMTRMNLAFTRHRMGDTQGVDGVYAEVAQIWRDVGNPLFLSQVLVERALLAHQVGGDLDGGWQGLEEAEGIILAQEDPVTHIAYLIARGHYRRRRGENPGEEQALIEATPRLAAVLKLVHEQTTARYDGHP